ncbi:TetR/AcrR family transcriptional regulator [Winogradskya humida]|uniref:TetR family transcriptional regulator n=1 Tax=Winogradskya humida TaxID=113566 RepID=A0ABQ3ZUM7_9ACTN|nr:TetR/AcrR family transcriptional regulator [Actinoplanes humidus]GIE22290.1 TetR family transcriptional regulator [Actinoplanes humidus]
MPRWEPNARERLERAAIELFAAQGYEATTIEQIAAAAGLNRSTFFRHFGDKRETLFGGQQGLPAHLADTITKAPADLTPLEAVTAAFDAAATVWFAPDRRDLAPRRLAVVASSPEFRERELLKRLDITTAVAAALRSRGLSDPSATVAAELATLTFTRTITIWADPANTEEFSPIARRVLRELHTAATQLD